MRNLHPRQDSKTSELIEVFMEDMTRAELCPVARFVAIIGWTKKCHGLLISALAKLSARLTVKFICLSSVVDGKVEWWAMTSFY